MKTDRFRRRRVSMSPRSPWRASMSCWATDRGCCNEHSRLQDSVDRPSPRLAPAGGPALLRGKGTARGRGNAQLRAISVRVDRVGMSGAAAAPYRAPVAGVQVAIEQDPGELRPEIGRAAGR